MVLHLCHANRCDMVFQHHVHQPAVVSFCLKYNTPVELRHARTYAAVKQSCSRDELASFSKVLWLSQAILTDKDPQDENITLIVFPCYACVATYVCTYVRMSVPLFAYPQSISLLCITLLRVSCFHGFLLTHIGHFFLNLKLHMIITLRTRG